MTQEDKELLLKDLCARLPYAAKVFYEYVDVLDKKTYGYSLTLNTWCVDELKAEKAIVKPYLRPMSSMTRVEVLEYINLKESIVASDDITYSFETYKSIDWLNRKMFDYRGLIPLGLALKAPEGMYSN